MFPPLVSTRSGSKSQHLKDVISTGNTGPPTILAIKLYSKIIITESMIMINKNMVVWKKRDQQVLLPSLISPLNIRATIVPARLDLCLANLNFPSRPYAPQKTPYPHVAETKLFAPGIRIRCFALCMIGYLRSKRSASITFTQAAIKS